MKDISFLGILFLLICSCTTSDDNKPGPADAKFMVHPNSRLAINDTENGRFIEIVEGDLVVFEYQNIMESDPNIADSGYHDYLVFEMDRNTGDFQLKNEDLLNAKTYLRHSCYCAHTDYRAVTAGNISARKTGDLEWSISFNVEAHINEDPEFSYSIQMKDSGTFRPIE